MLQAQQATDLYGQTHSTRIVIQVLLDQIFKASQIDPAIISPDDYLGEDLGLSKALIQSIIVQTAMDLSLELPPVDVDDFSSRQIVELLNRYDFKIKDSAVA